MKVTFVTGNMGKWEIGRDIFARYGLELAQAKMETPEIQSLDVTEVAAYSAQYAAKKLNTPVIKSDVGYYIPALGGFPGPFIKYINQTLSDKDLLRLMKGVKDRSMIICFLYPACFKSQYRFQLRSIIYSIGLCQ